jgi:hypothetical protein
LAAYSKHGFPVAANVLNRQFNSVAPNSAFAKSLTFGPSWMAILSDGQITDTMIFNP